MARKRRQDTSAALSFENGPSDSDLRRALDVRGFAILRGLVRPPELERLVQAFENGEPGANPDGGTRHPNLDWSQPVLKRVLSEPRVLVAVDTVLGRPFVVLQAGGRDPLPGNGQQGLHTDWPPRSGREPFHVVTALWLLDDFTEYNGATRVVGGSHRNPRPFDKSMQQPRARHPKQELIRARAGDVVVLNGHVWHSGTRNESDRPRRVLQIQYVAREVRPPRAEGERAPEESATVFDIQGTP